MAPANDDIEQLRFLCPPGHRLHCQEARGYHDAEEVQPARWLAARQGGSVPDQPFLGDVTEAGPRQVLEAFPDVNHPEL